MCLCDNIGLVALLLLGWELRASSITVLCVQAVMILSPLLFMPSLYSHSNSKNFYITCYIWYTLRLQTCSALSSAEMSVSSQHSSVLCPMCQFQSPTLALSLSHLRLVHRNVPRFSVRCGISGCTYTGKSFSAFYSHVYRKHYDVGVIQKRVATCPELSSRLREAVATPVTSVHSSFIGVEGPESQGKLPTS